MATTKSVGDPLGNDKEPGSDAQVDAKEYVMYMVESTRHWFYAPRNKYKDIAGDLGIKEVNADSKDGANAVKLAGGQGYIRVMAKLDNGANIALVCDPKKVGSILEGSGDNNKVYGVKIRRIYLPKKRIFI